MSVGEHWKAREVKAFSTLKVVMSSDVWEHLMGWCKAASSEVSGMMLVNYDDKKGVIEVSSIYLPKQECGAASTEIDDDALAELQMQIHKEGKSTKTLRGWWHTHYNFNVFWSATDVGTINKLMSGNDWFLSIVVNQAEEFKARLDIASPFPIVIDDMDIEVTGVHEDLSKFKKDIEAQVSQKKYHHEYLPYFHHNGYGSGYGGYGRFDGSAATGPKEASHWSEKYDPELWHGYKDFEPVGRQVNPRAACRTIDNQSEADARAEAEYDELLMNEYGGGSSAYDISNDPLTEPTGVTLAQARDILKGEVKK